MQEARLISCTYQSGGERLGKHKPVQSSDDLRGNWLRGCNKKKRVILVLTTKKNKNYGNFNNFFSINNYFKFFSSIPTW
jgi:Tfp pilus assembly protein FimT